jgi:hypothetical protein
MSHGLAAGRHASATELEAGTARGALDGVAEALTELRCSQGLVANALSSALD